MSQLETKSPAKPQTVAFIGTGNMGMPLIERLLAAGYTLRVTDKFATNKDRLTHQSLSWHPTPREACDGAETAITCLPLPHHVLENMLGPDGALAGMTSGTTWIDTSTTDYHNTRHIAEFATQKGVYSLEAPVSNLSHMGVDFANVCFYVGGDKSAYSANADLFSCMGRRSYHVGEILMGQTVKLFTNMLFYTALVTWGDILVLARRNELPLIWFWGKARESEANCFVVDQLTPFILDGSYDRSCTLEIAVKDTQLVMDLADEENCSAPLASIIRARYAFAGTKYEQLDNHVLVVQLSEGEANTSLQVPGFEAPSPYGANSDYRHSSQLITDEHGRIKPLVNPSYYASDEVAEASQLPLANELLGLMAAVNFQILREMRVLGERKGLSLDLIEDVVRWSCGPSWVADNLFGYKPRSDFDHLASSAQNASLTTLADVARVIGTRASVAVA